MHTGTQEHTCKTDAPTGRPCQPPVAAQAPSALERQSSVNGTPRAGERRCTRGAALREPRPTPPRSLARHLHPRAGGATSVAASPQSTCQFRRARPPDAPRKLQRLRRSSPAAGCARRWPGAAASHQDPPAARDPPQQRQRYPACSRGCHAPRALRPTTGPKPHWARQPLQHRRRPLSAPSRRRHRWRAPWRIAPPRAPPRARHSRQPRPRAPRAGPCLHALPPEPPLHAPPPPARFRWQPQHLLA